VPTAGERISSLALHLCNNAETYRRAAHSRDLA